MVMYKADNWQFTIEEVEGKQDALDNNCIIIEPNNDKITIDCLQGGGKSYHSTWEKAWRFMLTQAEEQLKEYDKQRDRIKNNIRIISDLKKDQYAVE